MTDAALAQSDAEPDADRIAELEREIYTLRANLVECADTLSAQQFNQAQQNRIEACRAELAALAQSEPDPLPRQHQDPSKWVMEPARSDAEPVCLWRYKGEKLWHECNEAEYHVLGDNPEDVERRLLYTSPPRPDGSGLDDGPWLPGHGPRKRPPQKSREELAAIRAKAWKTRRAAGSGND